MKFYGFTEQRKSGGWLQKERQSEDCGLLSSGIAKGF